MMTSQQAQNRAMRREQVERYLATDMTVREWCDLNGVAESTMYRWMSVFRKEEPDLFADPTCGEWIELSRGSVAARTALAVRPTEGPRDEGAAERDEEAVECVPTWPRARWSCASAAPTWWSPRASPSRTLQWC